MIQLKEKLSPNNRLVLFYDSTVVPLPDDRSRGITDALKIATLLQKKHICVLVDTSTLSPEELHLAYAKAVGTSVYKKYRIRQVFGSRRRSGWLFGRHVPALFVYERNFPTVVAKKPGIEVLFKQAQTRVDLGQKIPDEVYPRDEDGMIVTIGDFLEQFRA